MRVAYSFILLFSLFAHTASGQFIQCNSPTNAELKDVYFISSQTGIAVGDSGTIIRSNDGGLNWSLVLSIDSVWFSKVKFFNSSDGLAIGRMIYSTNDSGKTWTHIPHTNSQFIDLAILNDSTCLITGYPDALIRSTNKGLSFSTIQSTTITGSNLISFVNDSIGYACTYSGGSSTETLKTIDGGFNWTVIKDSTSSNNPTVMEAISFISPSIGFKGGWYNRHLEKTTNGGQDWNIMNYTDPMSTGQIKDFHISAAIPNAYYSCGWYGEIYKSTDLGNNWFSLNSGLSNTTTLNGIFFIDEFTGWAVGANGVVIKTTSGGIGIEENSELEISIYPNPAYDKINLKIPIGISDYSAVIFDLYGKTIFHSDKSIETIDITTLGKGLYILKIEGHNFNYCKAFIKH